MADDFFAFFARLAATHRWNPSVSPAQLLERWSVFVSECESGYADSIYEYDNDISVRDLLEAVVTDEEFARFPQAEPIGEAVHGIDERFRAACREGVQVGSESRPWWRRAVPRVALDEFADDLQRLYGIESPAEGA